MFVAGLLELCKKWWKYLKWFENVGNPGKVRKGIPEDFKEGTEEVYWFWYVFITSNLTENKRFFSLDVLTTCHIVIMERKIHSTLFILSRFFRLQKQTNEKKKQKQSHQDYFPFLVDFETQTKIWF